MVNAVYINLIGSSGDKILIVGDSAGGNLAIATAMRAASFGIRSPDSVVCVYPCTVVRYTPSPARLLSLLDPVLPVGLVVRCLAAYAGVNEEHPLSTPKMDDVHSQKSLTRIQLGTYETHDSDWLIIDKDRCPKDILKKDTPHTPEYGTPSDLSATDIGDRGFRKSESMFNMNSVDISLVNHGNNIRRQSDTEIFSQLINDGSCVFPAGSNVSDPKLPGASSCSTTVLDSSGHRNVDGPFNLGRLQQRAKLMMESAHSLFNSLASLMPSSHDISPSFSKLRSKHSHKPPATVFSSHVLLPSQHSSSNDLFSVISDGEENSTTEESSSMHLDNSLSLPQGPHHSEQADFDEANLETCDDNRKMDSSINNSSLPSDDQSPSPTSSSSLIDTSPSFATALSSPFSPSEQRIREIGAECDDSSGAHLAAAGSLNLTDSLVRGINVSSLGEADKEKTLDQTVEEDPSHPPPEANAGPPHDDNVDPSSSVTENPHLEEKNGCDNHQCVDESKGTHSLEVCGDEDQTTFLCEGGLSSGEVSPEMMATLPEESRLLLEDALESVDQLDFSLLSLAGNTDAGNGISEAAPSTKTNPLNSLNIPDNFNSAVSIDADQLNINRLIPEQIDNECSKNTISNNLSTVRNHSTCLPDSESGEEAGCLEVKPREILQTGQPAVKPPNTLTLKKSFTTYSNHPSSPESPLTSGTPGSTRSESSLHQSSPKQFSSCPPSKILKCGSAPVLSSLSHSVSKSSSLSTLFSETELPHFSKTGMSPTDFDTRVFACHSPLHKLRKAPVVKNPYMSPLLASDELLKGLSKVCIVACHLDPLLDDSISFARRLRKLDVPVELHLIDDLPHGFLNFALFSYEAKKASEYCGKKIAELLQSTGV
ncbi:hypothetical protein Btru_023880 [Bulinus truncatus]|nr:hypothetical protein Btru_023880 [Bulinus truncatus]